MSAAPFDRRRLLRPGMWVVDADAPEALDMARYGGVIIAETTLTDSERGWIIARVDGRLVRDFVWPDERIHWCPPTDPPCHRCPAPHKRELVHVLRTLLRVDKQHTHTHTSGDRRRSDLIETVRRGLDPTKAAV